MSSESSEKSPSKQSPLKEGFDFYWDANGKMVLTSEYLKRRGTCCQNGCRHCPYGFSADSQIKKKSLPL